MYIDIPSSFYAAQASLPKVIPLKYNLKYGIIRDSGCYLGRVVTVERTVPN